MLFRTSLFFNFDFDFDFFYEINFLFFLRERGWTRIDSGFLTFLVARISVLEFGLVFSQNNVGGNFNLTNEGIIIEISRVHKHFIKVVRLVEIVIRVEHVVLLEIVFEFLLLYKSF